MVFGYDLRFVKGLRLLFGVLRRKWGLSEACSFLQRLSSLKWPLA